MFTKEFKEAISELPPQEKDKLILRLLKKDMNLANRLSFELTSTQSVDEKRLQLAERIVSQVKHFKQTFYSMGYLIMDIRYLSGEITEHVYITKDKYGEISLNILLTLEVLKQHNDSLQNGKPIQKSYKLAEGLVARIFKILLLINKLDEDYFIEFKNDLAEIGELMGEIPIMMKAAINKGLDVNWLIQSEIPNDIEQIYKLSRTI